MPDQKILPPSLELVEIENDRLRKALAEVERILVLDKPKAIERAVAACRRVLNI
jgi:hypothetical protein